MARECGQAGGQSRSSSSVPVPVDPVPDVPVPVPVDPVPDDPAPVPGSEDDGDLSSVSSDLPDPPAPDPVPVPSYPSLTLCSSQTPY